MLWIDESCVAVICRESSPLTWCAAAGVTWRRMRQRGARSEACLRTFILRSCHWQFAECHQIYTFSAHKYIIKNLCKRRAGIERPTTRMRWKEGNENGWSDGFYLISNQHWDRLMCLLLLLLLVSQDKLSCSHEWGFVRMESPKATENTLIETWLEIFRNINGWR